MATTTTATRHRRSPEMNRRLAAQDARRLAREGAPAWQVEQARIQAQDAQMPEALRNVLSRPARPASDPATQPTQPTTTRRETAMAASRMDNRGISIFK